MREFGRLAWICVSVNLGLNALLVLFMMVLVLRTLRSVIEGVQYKAVVTHLLRRIPQQTCKKVYRCEPPDCIRDLCVPIVLRRG